MHLLQALRKLLVLGVNGLLGFLGLVRAEDGVHYSLIEHALVAAEHPNFFSLVANEQLSEMHLTSVFGIFFIKKTGDKLLGNKAMRHILAEFLLRSVGIEDALCEIALRLDEVDFC